MPQYARIAHDQYNDGLLPLAARSIGSSGPSQIARPTAGTNTIVVSHSGGRRTFTTAPISRLSPRYSIELDATPPPSTCARAPAVPGTSTSSGVVNALAVASVNATMTRISASQM